MVRLLIICYGYPSPSVAGSLRVLHSLKNLSEKYGHDITLVGFKLQGKEYPDISNYCRVETIEIAPRRGLKSPRAILRTLKNVLSGHLSFYNYAYLPVMNRKITYLLNNNTFDVLLVDHPSMLTYTANKGVPTVLLEAYALSKIALMHYKLEKNRLIKIVRLLQYYQMRSYAKKYRTANASIAVSAQQKEMVISHCPDLDITVIPHGIETDYFRVVEPESEFPCLIITGSMGGSANKGAVIYFYNEIYPLIKARISKIKLYIVGSNPGKEIKQLAADKSVVVTGYVADLRPYLSRAWVVVAPLQEGFGVKVRVLQAMAVGKPVVSTSMVMGGIDLLPGENIIIADEPAEFAERVIELLNDRQQRERIGARARQLMEINHSWDKLTDRLNEVIEKAAVRNHPLGGERNSWLAY